MASLSGAIQHQAARMHKAASRIQAGLKAARDRHMLPRLYSLTVAWICIQAGCTRLLTQPPSPTQNLHATIRAVGDGVLVFRHKVEELERRFAASGVPADHEDLLNFDDLIDDGSSDTSDVVPHAPRVGQSDVARNSTIQEVKAHWDSLNIAMQTLTPPNVVTAAATAALTATAAQWGFSPTGAAEAVMRKCEERLPQSFGSTALGALGKVLCVLSSNVAIAIWRHVKIQQAAATGSSTHMPSMCDNMAAVSAAWGMHYEQHLQHGCQRRNRLIEQTLARMASAMTELFAELDDTTHLGFSATTMRVADEAGDVWYGAQCYAAAYTEQVQRVFAGWTHSMRMCTATAQPSPATVTWRLVSEVLSTRTPGMHAMVQLLRATSSRRQA